MTVLAGVSRILRCLATVAAFWCILGAGREAHARVFGVGSTLFGADTVGCNHCHGGGTPPAVNLTAVPVVGTTTFQITLTLTVTTPNGVPGGAGFNLRSSQQGVFALGGPNSTGVQILPAPGIAPTTNGWSEATHLTGPKEGEPATFTVLWTPSLGTTGTVTFTAWGNAVNENGNNQGDMAASFILPNVSICTPVVSYRDADGDGYGAAAGVLTSCAIPAGYVANNTDCDDTNLAIHPGVTEICNGVDDNCVGGIDDGLVPMTFYQDADADTYGNAAVSKTACSLALAGPGYVLDHTDCDDTNPSIHPGAPEICANLKDDNCNGTVDTDAPATSTFYRDADGDGFGLATTTTAACAPPAGYVADNTDCNDANPAVHPGATEACNGIDDNCDGHTDDGLGTVNCGVDPCVTTVAACSGGVPQVCTPVCPDAGAGGGGAGGAGGETPGSGGAGGVLGNGGAGGAPASGGAGGVPGSGGEAGVSGSGGVAGVSGTGGVGIGGTSAGGGGGGAPGTGGAAGSAVVSDAGSPANDAAVLDARADASDVKGDVGSLPSGLPGKTNDGCGCRTAPQRPVNDFLSLAGVVGLVLLSRRRRR